MQHGRRDFIGLIDGTACQTLLDLVERGEEELAAIALALPGR